MTQIDTDLIKANVDLVDLAGQVVKLRKVAAGEYAGPCPKCGGTDRLHVKADWWFCRQCWPPDNGKGHDAIAWVMWLDGVDFREACRRLDSGAVPTDRPRRAPEPSARRYKWGDPAWQAEARTFVHEAVQRLASPTLGEPGRAYLAGRGITQETWQAWGLGYATPRHPRLRAERPAICLPWQGRGTLKAVQYRFYGDGIEHGDRFAQRPGGERTLYGVDLLGTHCDTLVLVEGELNALSIWQEARDRLDVVSFGSDSNAGGDLAHRLAARYRRVLVWADDPDKARLAMGAIPGARGLRSVEQDGQKLDANALLQAGALADFLLAARARAERPTAGEALGLLQDTARPLTDRLGAVRDWLRDREVRGELGPDYDNVLTRWLGMLGEYEREVRI